MATPLATYVCFLTFIALAVKLMLMRLRCDDVRRSRFPAGRAAWAPARSTLVSTRLSLFRRASVLASRLYVLLARCAAVALLVCCTIAASCMPVAPPALTPAPSAHSLTSCCTSLSLLSPHLVLCVSCICVSADREGNVNYEYLSLGADNTQFGQFGGRSPLNVYAGVLRLPSALTCSRVGAALAAVRRAVLLRVCPVPRHQSHPPSAALLSADSLCRSTMQQSFSGVTFRLMCHLIVLQTSWPRSATWCTPT